MDAFPDKEEENKNLNSFNVFITTFITFFMAEMGDKTQLTTVALAAKYQNLPMVTLGTTMGMMISDGAAVFFGEKITKILPLKWLRFIASLLFLIFGIMILLVGK